MQLICVWMSGRVQPCEYCRERDISVIAGACPMMYGKGVDVGHTVPAMDPQTHGWPAHVRRRSNEMAEEERGEDRLFGVRYPNNSSLILAKVSLCDAPTQSVVLTPLSSVQRSVPVSRDNPHITNWRN
jgi:hypothetical protein